MKIKGSQKRRMTGNSLLLLTLLFWILSGITCLVLLNLNDGKQNVGEEVGKRYLAAAYPVISRSAGYEPRDSINDNILHGQEESGDHSDDVPDIDDTGNNELIDSAASNSPLIFIYHTHATESYQPVSEGNFHSTGETGTVREVGSVLTAALASKGIPAIHNKTLHDSPSYSKSYSRSMKTVEEALSTYPTIQIVIDLHRDAAAYTGNVGHTFNVEGRKASQFCLVVGEGNDNAAKLTAFANMVNQKANDLYPGFSRGIIKKEYKYNQYIFDNYLLVEMGNNQNHIDEAKLSAEYLAEVLAKVIEEM